MLYSVSGRVSQTRKEAVSTITEKRPVQVGDIFVSSWGYDQTNIDYYKVVGVTPSGKSAKIVRIGQTFVERHGPGGDRVVPNPDAVLCDRCGRVEGDYIHTEGRWSYVTNERVRHDFEAKPETKRIQAGWNGEPSIKVRSFAWAHPWHGGSSYQTDSLYGH